MTIGDIRLFVSRPAVIEKLVLVLFVAGLPLLHRRLLPCPQIKRVYRVQSGEDALAFLEDKEVDLLVLDMIIEPGMDGLDTSAFLLTLLIIDVLSIIRSSVAM